MIPFKGSFKVWPGPWTGTWQCGRPQARGGTLARVGSHERDLVAAAAPSSAFGAFLPHRSPIVPTLAGFDTPGWAHHAGDWSLSLLLHELGFSITVPEYAAQRSGALVDDKYLVFGPLRVRGGTGGVWGRAGV